MFPQSKQCFCWDHTYILIKHTQTYIYILKKILKPPGVILETEGCVQKIQKGALFQSKKVKKGNPNLTSPYVHSLTIVLIKLVFEKKNHWWQHPEVGLNQLTKTVVALTVVLLMTESSFVARMTFSWKTDFLFDQIIQLMKTIYSVTMIVYLVIVTI